MLQAQYFNSKLNKDQIEKILSNYNIKYNTMKNEIDAKFSNMIKLFINDIRPFLENIEEITNERKKLKELENREREIESLRERLNEKISNEHKMKNDLDILKKENTDLKTRIKNKRKNVLFKPNRSKEKNYYDTNKSFSKLEESKSYVKNSYYKNLSGVQSVQNKSKKNIHKKIISYTIKEEKTKPIKKEKEKEKERMNSTERRIDRKNCIGNIIPKPKIQNGSAEKKKIYNPNILTDSPINKNVKKIIMSQNQNTAKAHYKKKMLKMEIKTGNISDDNLGIDHDYEIINDEDNKQKSEFENSEESGLMNEDVIDDEIKELEMDEENIKKLIEDIKDFQMDLENGKTD